MISKTLLAILAATTGASVASAQNDNRGKQIFEECVVCHSLQAEGSSPATADNIGPNLRGVFGRKAGTREDFRYSGPMKRSGVVWSRATMDPFIADPQAMMPGTRMPYSGMSEAANRKVLIDYLEQATR